MTTLTEALQAACRAITGTSGTFEEDLHAFFNQIGYPAGQFGERVLRYAQSETGTIITATAGFNYMLENPPGPNLYPDPSLTNETDYSLTGDVTKLPGTLRFTPGGFGFALVDTTGALDTATLAAIANATTYNVSVNVNNYVADGGNLEISLKGGASVFLNVTANGWSTPVSVTSGSGIPGLHLADASGVVNLDIADIMIRA